MLWFDIKIKTYVHDVSMTLDFLFCRRGNARRQSEPIVSPVSCSSCFVSVDGRLMCLFN